MFLKRLELVGFKSFASKTVAELPPGIVAVVGPNGSGKSNIADAVRWVLGEQSAKAVRARKPEEVIFAGSAARQPLGMAEVSLVLDNADGTVPLDYAELRVTRRLYRSGESEYLLNNARVRLKDITNYLLHAQLGPDSYSVIGQGSVDELILQRPEERRIAFESAADVRRHQIKLTDTRHKLTATEANLVRVQDVVAELAPHVRRLKAQADRASRAETLSAELHRLLVRYYRHRLREARVEADAAERALAQASSGLERAHEATARADEARRGGESALVELDERLAELRPRVDAEREALRSAERALAVARERTASIAQQRLALISEIDRLSQRIGVLRDEVEQHQRADEADAEEPGDDADNLAAVRNRAQEVSVELNRGQGELLAARRVRDAADRRIVELETAAARDEQRLHALEAAEAVDEARRVDRGTRVETLTAALATTTAALGAAQPALAEAERALAAADLARRAAVDRASAVREAARAAATQADRLHGALEALGVGDVAPAEHGPPEWVSALRGLEVLGFAGEMAARVRPLDRLLRGYLMRTVVVRDDATAREVHRRLSESLSSGTPAWAVLSLDGLLLGAGGAPRIASAGDAEAPALADWRRQVRALEEEHAAAESARASAERALAVATDELSAADRAQSAARARRQEAQSEVQQLQRTETSTRAELGRVRAEIAQDSQRLEHAGQDRQEREARLRQLAGSLAEARSERDEVMARMRAAEERVAALAEQVASVRGRLTVLETTHARRVAERQSRHGLLARIQGELHAAEGALRAAEERKGDLARQAEDLVQEEERIQRDARAAQAALTPAEADLAEADRQRQARAADRRVAEGRVAELRAGERLAQERREGALVRAQRARDALDRLEHEVAEAAEVDGEDGVDASWARQLRLSLEGDAAAEDREPVVDLEGMRRRISWLQRELRAVGGVSESVMDEFREMSERHDFLLHQAEDLHKAMAELREAAAELEEHMRGRFAEVFEAVNTAFQESFQTLFGGGEARLVLTQPDDLLATGIDVVARPPGKKLQGLLSLSGGERALTIVALLFGLLKVNPTPFCVLDEVDAALDEANVQRFAELLARFSRQIQFVVVTHNRATMERADAMYGVTMDTAGVSHVLSVKPSVILA